MQDSLKIPESDRDIPAVMRGLDPRIHPLRKDGLPGQARQ
jgi:hypothetical protein